MRRPILTITGDFGEESYKYFGIWFDKIHFL